MILITARPLALFWTLALLGGGTPGDGTRALDNPTFPDNSSPKGNYSVPTQEANCAAAAFQTLGQAWRVGFSTGGFIPEAGNLTGRGTVAEPGLGPSSRYRAIFPKLSRSLPTSIKTPVHVVIIDNFNAVPVTMDVSAPNKVDPGATELKTTLTIPHGDVVLYHIYRLLKSDNFNSSDYLNYYRASDGRHIVIHPVSINPEGEVTKDIVDKLNKVFDDSLDNSPIIVNMSLALLPCETLRDYASRVKQHKDRHYTLNDYFAEKAQGTTMTATEYARSKLQNAVHDDDPLLVYLSGLQNRAKDMGYPMIMVASSGNFGLHFSTIPAALPLQRPTTTPALKVIAVGATTWDGNSPGLRNRPHSGDNFTADAMWSDWGDVTSVGEWFPLPQTVLDQICAHGADPGCSAKDWKHPAYRGTSFSAPSITALLASRIDTTQSYPYGQNGARVLCISGSNKHEPIGKVNGNKHDIRIDGSWLCVDAPNN